MEKNKVFIITAVVIFLIFISAFIIFVKMDRQYKFEAEQNGVRFVSDADDISTGLANFSGKNRFVVSPAFVEESPGNSLMGEAQIISSVVLIIKGKVVVQTVRGYDAEGILLNCATNDANVHVNRNIDPVECNEIISSETSGILLIQQPNTTLAKSEVELKGNVIEIRPKSYEDAPVAAFAVLEAMYPDSRQIVQGTNDLLGRVRA